MKIYYIEVSSWDGSHAYTLDYIRPFLTKEKRDEAYEKMRLSPAYKRGDIWLNIDEDEVEDAPEEAVEGRIEYVNGFATLDNVVLHPRDYKNGQKVRIIVNEEE